MKWYIRHWFLEVLFKPFLINHFLRSLGSVLALSLTGRSRVNVENVTSIVLLRSWRKSIYILSTKVMGIHMLLVLLLLILLLFSWLLIVVISFLILLAIPFILLSYSTSIFIVFVIWISLFFFIVVSFSQMGKDTRLIFLLINA